MRRYMTGVARGVAVKFVVLAVLVGGGMDVLAQSPSDYQRILQEKSPAFVTIKFTLKVKTGGKETENQDEATGVLIDPKGLILCSSTRLGGIGSLYRSMGRDITTSATDLKVLVGDDTEGLEAKVLTRDTELDLAWVQIKEPGQRKFACIDLSDAAEGKVGEPVIAIRRMTKMFDHLAVISESRIAGIARKPRRLYVPAAPLSGEFGLPVFAADGKVLGVPVLQRLNEEDQDQNSADRGQIMQELVSGLILPAADVVAATQQARLTAATQPAVNETQPASSEPASSQPAASHKDKPATPTTGPQDRD